MAQTTRPMLAAPRAAQTLEAVRSVTGGFDVDAWRVINGRDDSLIADEIVNGVVSEKFVYQFQVAGTDVVGISVIGARYLAYHYGGLKHRIVASVQKNAELFTHTTYPHGATPMQVSCSVIRELADQPDFHKVLVEITDSQNGNSIQIEKQEFRFEKRRDGTEFARPHFQEICLSKALRNGILSLVPADVQIKWRNRMVADKKMVDITGSVIEEKRSGVLRYAAKQGLVVDRRAVEDLTLDQIAGLGDAARAEEQGAFVNAAKALGLEISLGGGEETGEVAQQTGQPAQQQQPQTQPLGSNAAQANQAGEPKRRGRPSKKPEQAQAQPEQQVAQEGAGEPEGDQGGDDAPEAEQASPEPAAATSAPQQQQPASASPAKARPQLNFE